MGVTIQQISWLNIALKVILTQIWSHFFELAQCSCSVLREKRRILCSQLLQKQKCCMIHFAEDPIDRLEMYIVQKKYW